MNFVLENHYYLSYFKNKDKTCEYYNLENNQGKKSILTFRFIEKSKISI
jgi:hypothetical protein